MSTLLLIMNPSSTVKHPSKDQFLQQANAAVLRVSRQVAAENKRLGLPLIVNVARHRPPARKVKA